VVVVKTGTDKDDFYDGCPLCRLMKQAEKEGRAVKMDELQEGLLAAEAGGGVVGGPLVEEGEPD